MKKPLPNTNTPPTTQSQKLGKAKRKILLLLEGIRKHSDLMADFYNQLLCNVVEPLSKWIEASAVKGNSVLDIAVRRKYEPYPKPTLCQMAAYNHLITALSVLAQLLLHERRILSILYPMFPSQLCTDVLGTQEKQLRVMLATASVMPLIWNGVATVKSHHKADRMHLLTAPNWLQNCVYRTVSVIKIMIQQLHFIVSLMKAPSNQWNEKLKYENVFPYKLQQLEGRLPQFKSWAVWAQKSKV